MHESSEVTLDAGPLATDQGCHLLDSDLNHRVVTVRDATVAGCLVDVKSERAEPLISPAAVRGILQGTRCALAYHLWGVMVPVLSGNTTQEQEDLRNYW